jgi:hypothetical protein
MKFTKETHKLMSFFIDNNCLQPIKQTKKTDLILKRLYNEIKEGVSYISQVKTKIGDTFYRLSIDHITNVNQIPKPSTFPPNAFPNDVRIHIDEFSLSLLTYSFHLFKRNINIIFLTEDGNPEELIDIYNNYVDYMLVWLYIVDGYSSRNCASDLKIFIYHTSLLKNLPKTNIEILNENNVNTAFTRTCPTNSEIVVFRKEEWFKVFIHETFHNFGLDFSNMNMNNCNNKILELFPVNSDVNLYEAYTEFWARLMNSLFCSFINMKHKNNINEFLSNAEVFINFERIFSFFQMVKVLKFMDMSYINLYEKTDNSEYIRKTMYKENTSVLSYYVITLILFNNYQEFLTWCNTNNTSLLQFKKTISNLDSFCKFIEKKYKTKNMLEGVSCTEKLVNNVNRSSKKRKSLLYIANNLRMTICELG